MYEVNKNKRDSIVVSIVINGHFFNCYDINVTFTRNFLLSLVFYLHVYIHLILLCYSTFYGCLILIMLFRCKGFCCIFAQLIMYEILHLYYLRYFLIILI